MSFRGFALIALGAALLVSSSTQSTTVAHCCGVVMGAVMMYWSQQRERERFLRQTSGAINEVLHGFKTVLEVEAAKRSELEREATHYRRLYLQKLERAK